MCVCMHFHDGVHITRTHTHMYAHTYVRATTCIHAYLELCDGHVDWDVFSCAYIHIPFYICIYTHTYRTMWWPSWWGRTHVWEQTALCCCWIATLLCVFYRSSLLTSGELIYVRACMFVCMHMYAAVGSFSRCICCTLYTCTCLLLASAYVLVCVQLFSWLRSHTSYSSVCVWVEPKNSQGKSFVRLCKHNKWTDHCVWHVYTIHAAMHIHMQTCTFLTRMFAPGIGALGSSKAALRGTDRHTAGSTCVREPRHTCMYVCMYASTSIHEKQSVSRAPHSYVCMRVYMYICIHLWGMFGTGYLRNFSA